MSDPIQPIYEMAGSFADVETSMSCNQNAFKVGKVSFLFIGPGNKGVGYKAMFKLDKSLGQATKLAEKDADRIQVGVNGWVTARFTDKKPLAKTVWKKWLKESYELTINRGLAKKRKAKKKAPAKKVKKESIKKSVKKSTKKPRKKAN